MYAAFKRIRFGAMPNMVSGRMITPEVRVEDSSSEITQPVLELIRNKEQRESIGRELQSAMGKPGAVNILCDEVKSILQER